MTVLARPEPLPRLVLVDLSVALLAGLMLALALWLPAAPPPFSRIYQNLHTPETSAIGTYAWSYPEFSLYLPLARAGRAALVHQRMAAGATPSDTRPIMVNAGDFRLRFMVRGGTPLRTYHYLLPTHSPVLNAWFQVAPLDYENPSDRRALGVVLADTQVQILGGSGLPGPAALALLALPVPLLLAGWGLGLGAWRRPALLLIALSVALFFRADPSAVLPLTLPLNGGLLVVAALGALCRRLLAAVGPGNASSGSLLLWGLAAVIGPWTYIGAGLWRNLGRQWAGQALLVELLLGLPVLAVALYLWLPALRRQSALLAGLALAGVLSWGLLNLRFELSNVATDFSAYYYGARRMLNGEPLYELARLREGPFAITYKYHPFFLTFVLPVMLFPLDVAIAAWRGAGLIWIVAAIAIIIAAQPVDLRRRLALIGLVIATNLAPIGQTLRLGQADPLILIGVVLGVALMRRYSWLSAAIWGMLGVIKIYPLFLLLPALFQRLWRWLALVVAVGAVAVLVSLAFGWQNQLAYWRDVVPLLGARNGSLANQALYGLIVRSINPAIVGDSQATIPTPAANAPFLLLVALIVGLSAWLVWRRHLWRMPWEATSLLICTLLLIMPVSWDQYQTLLLLPLLVGAAHTMRAAERPSLLLMAAYALLAFGMIKNLWQGDTPLTTFGLLFMAYRTLGLGLLWGWWLRYALRLPRCSA